MKRKRNEKEKKKKSKKKKKTKPAKTLCVHLPSTIDGQKEMNLKYT